jgi:hypothetical protein
MTNNIITFYYILQNWNFLLFRVFNRRQGSQSFFKSWQSLFTDQHFLRAEATMLIVLANGTHKQNRYPFSKLTNQLLKKKSQKKLLLKNTLKVNCEGGLYYILLQINTIKCKIYY